MLLRAVRKTADVERGKPTARLGLVLKLLTGAGVVLFADISDSAEQELERQRTKLAKNASAPYV
ncbi:hypothetical protein [Ramlibacter albus]|uniref:Uncharacterized protein n=1 Tax=Ramlibacter albus TaxID=2079448 RepID=A0A923M4I5_9BURK|nr:hypothetical protein [Ramlibacter albus]MBC5763758.1 hypothetical protein [Ramlibacter albus]